MFELNGKKIHSARVTACAGHGVSNNVYMECYVEGGDLTTAEIGIVQDKIGYHPDGYGGPNRIERSQLEMGVVRYTWSCYASCD